jgi:hypothetical protein
VEWSNHTHVVLWVSPFVGEMIKSHTCGFVDKSRTYPQYHMFMILLFHLQMDISTIPRVSLYHSTYKWTYPQNHMCVILSFHLQMDLPTKPHVCDLIIPPTNGLIHNTVVLWISPFVGGMIKSHTCGIVDKSICRWNDQITHMWFCG